MGTLINTAAIAAGGLIGLLIGSRLSKRFQTVLVMALAMSVIAMSLSGIVSAMLTVTENGVQTHGTYVLIFCLVLGGLLGEIINIDAGIERLGAFLKKRSGNSGDSTFMRGFINASLTVCIGAMAVVGAIEDGIHGDSSILLTKSILDFVIVLVMTASLGKGCIFSAIPVAIFQGTITLLAKLVAPLMNDAAVNNLSLIGSVLILSVGVNLIAEGKFRLKVANLLPSILFAVAAAYIPFLQG